MISSKVAWSRTVSNTNEQRSQSGLCERVFRCEATETEGLVIYQNTIAQGWMYIYI